MHCHFVGIIMSRLIYDVRDNGPQYTGYKTRHLFSYIMRVITAKLFFSKSDNKFVLCIRVMFICILKGETVIKNYNE